MKKTKLLKPILASLIIESLLISPLSAANQCNIDEGKQQLLDQLNRENLDTTYALYVMGTRLKNVRDLKENAIKKISSLKSVDEKEQHQNKLNHDKVIEENNKPIEDFSTTEMLIRKVELKDNNLHLSIQIESTGESGVISERTAMAVKAYNFNKSISSFELALKQGQKEALSDYLAKNKYEKLQYILKNTNDYKEFGRCLSDENFQKSENCDVFAPTLSNKDPVARAKYFLELEEESDNYYQQFKNVEIEETKLSAGQKNYNQILDKTLPNRQMVNSNVIPKNKHLNVFDPLSLKAMKENNTQNPISQKNANYFSNKLPFSKKVDTNDIKTKQNINEIANYILNENITNVGNHIITVKMPNNASIDMQKAYAYHSEVGKLSNLELLFLKPVENIYDKNEIVNAFTDRLETQLNETRNLAKKYEEDCLISLKNNIKNPGKIPDEKMEVCSGHSQQFVTSLDDYASNISQGVNELKSSMDSKLDDKFYAVEELKLSLLKEAYAKCKTENSLFNPSAGIVIYPCAQISSTKSMGFSNISNFGESSIFIAKNITEADLKKRDDDIDKKQVACEVILKDKKIDNNSLIFNYCNQVNVQINESHKKIALNKRRNEQQMRETEKNYHLSMSTDGSNKIIKTPKQSFSEGFVRALVNNLATAAPGYMNYFQQGVMIDAMRSDGFIKKQALHNYKFYQNNVLAGQLPWYNSLSTFGYTVNSNLTYPINSTTTSTSLSGTGIGSGDFSF